MKSLRHSLFCFLLVMFLNLGTASAQTLGIAAVVNDEVISLYDLNSRLSLLIVSANQKDSAALRKRLSGQVLNRLIDEKLKMQQARKLGVSAKYAGSGGAVIGICQDENLLKKLKDKFSKIGCTVIRPVIH